MRGSTSRFQVQQSHTQYNQMKCHNNIAIVGRERDVDNDDIDEEDDEDDDNGDLDRPCTSGVGKRKRQALVLVRLANQRASCQKNLAISLIRDIYIRSPIDESALELPLDSD